ncbi:MAG: TIGR04282 family arsenosugar biosynthesis glycosyltransferase [Agarilytica sp.]
MTIGIVQFVKSPIVDSVKTRMQPTLSENAAKALHVNLAHHVAKVLSHYKHANTELWSSAECEFSKNMAQTYSIPLFSQTQGDLGARLKHAAQEALSRHQAVVIVGSDCPFLDNNYLDILLRKLHNHELVIGPASDGGYVAIAFKEFYPSLFENITWGGDQVFLQTLQAADVLSLSCATMTGLSDIDRPEDLQLLETNKYAHLLDGVPYLH